MGTQKNRLNETVLLSTQTNVKTNGEENIDNFTLKILLPMVHVLLQGEVLTFFLTKNHCLHAQRMEVDEGSDKKLDL